MSLKKSTDLILPPPKKKVKKLPIILYFSWKTALCLSTHLGYRRGVKFHYVGLTDMYKHLWTNEKQKLDILK